jgi:predicted cupin superfamily sugar epimerase
MQNPQDIIKFLDLHKHPEGGFYKEIYRSETIAKFDGFDGNRNLATGIYYLLEENDFSAFHRIKSDETWHFYDGETLELIEIDEEGELILTLIGNDIRNGDIPQYTVKAGNWFAARSRGEFSFVGCTVYPGFDFKDFEMAERTKLMNQFPDYHDVISLFTRHQNDWQENFPGLEV